MTIPFLSLADAITSEQIIKKSRFLAQATPISSEQAANDFLESVSIEHKSANHHPFAYVLGDNDEITRQSDAGEPAGTSGSPILNVITQNHLHNVLIVVTRYFGGIKLGSGGLIRAYGTSATQVVNTGQLVVRQALTRFSITLPYALAEPLTHWLTDRVVTVEQTDYGAAVTFTVLVTTDDASFITDLTSKTSGQAQLEKIADVFDMIPYER
ncbi:YigZ family protein [Furfurilactobacillus siliginis]|uniref:IMPACT family member yvyE n=1 Tax=Furfurilactobacillus siliginis TaxID=348151 RepID=A0A0R2LD80_9LACO|nr:YigZ family protein [Furfurilactobacillus siliginis]KRN96589.1 IMPACT family member yvyE [Furfurilactobacillus siliginis]GEK29074.1 YigZ family protein [Furfurilactobacillus siliginis]